MIVIRAAKMSRWKKLLRCGLNGKNRTSRNLKKLKENGALSLPIGLD
jgi:hypothetical protein